MQTINEISDVRIISMPKLDSAFKFLVRAIREEYSDLESHNDPDFLEFKSAIQASAKEVAWHAKNGTVISYSGKATQFLRILADREALIHEWPLKDKTRSAVDGLVAMADGIHMGRLKIEWPDKPLDQQTSVQPGNLKKFWDWLGEALFGIR